VTVPHTPTTTFVGTPRLWLSFADFSSVNSSMMVLIPHLSASAALRRCFAAVAASDVGADPQPLVLLLGWLGCEPRHLSKYASLYTSNFHAVVLPLQPTLLQTAAPGLADADALRYATDLEAAAAAQASASTAAPPVLVHVMSNAGWLAFGALLHLAASEASAAQPTSLQSLRRTLGRVRGVVIDSAPSEATPSIWARGTVSAALGKPAAGIEVEHPAAVRLAESWAARYLGRPRISARLKQVQYPLMLDWIGLIGLPCYELYRGVALHSKKGGALGCAGQRRGRQWSLLFTAFQHSSTRALCALADALCVGPARPAGAAALLVQLRRRSDPGRPRGGVHGAAGAAWAARGGAPLGGQRALRAPPPPPRGVHRPGAALCQAGAGGGAAAQCHGGAELGAAP